jgi:hypothetical protein
MLRFCEEAGDQIVTIAASEADFEGRALANRFFIVEAWLEELEQIAQRIDLRQVVLRANPEL